MNISYIFIFIFKDLFSVLLSLLVLFPLGKKELRFFPCFLRSSCFITRRKKKGERGAESARMRNAGGKKETKEKRATL